MKLIKTICFSGILLCVAQGHRLEEVQAETRHPRVSSACINICDNGCDNPAWYGSNDCQSACEAVENACDAACRAASGSWWTYSERVYNLRYQELVIVAEIHAQCLGSAN